MKRGADSQDVQSYRKKLRSSRGVVVDCTPPQSANVEMNHGKGSSSKQKKTSTKTPVKDITGSSSSGGSKAGQIDSEIKPPKETKIRLPKTDFRKNLLKPPVLQHSALPRFRRAFVPHPEKCADVVETIMTMCYQQESRYLIRHDFRKVQDDIGWRMREILVDWIVDVYYMLRLAAPTLWLTVNLIDRALLKIIVKRTSLQLVGVAALSLACKMEEVAIPYPDDLTYITDRAFNCQDLCDMELKILKVINYEVHVPTSYHYLTRYLELIHATDRTRQLAYYYAESNLQDRCGALTRPTLYAAAALYAALVQRQQQSEPSCSDSSTAALMSYLRSIDRLVDYLKKETEERCGDVRVVLEDWADQIASMLNDFGITKPAITTADAGDSECDNCGVSSSGTNKLGAEHKLSVVTTAAELWGVPLTLRGAVPKHQEIVAVWKSAMAERFCGKVGEESAARLLARWEESPPAILYMDVTEAEVVEGVQALLRELPTGISASEVQDLARTMIGSILIVRVTATKRNLDASARRFKRAVESYRHTMMPLPVFEGGTTTGSVEGSDVTDRDGSSCAGRSAKASSGNAGSSSGSSGSGAGSNSSDRSKWRVWCQCCEAYHPVGQEGADGTATTDEAAGTQAVEVAQASGSSSSSSSAIGTAKSSASSLPTSARSTVQRSAPSGTVTQPMTRAELRRRAGQGSNSNASQGQSAASHSYPLRSGGITPANIVMQV